MWSWGGGRLRGGAGRESRSSMEESLIAIVLLQSASSSFRFHSGS